MEQEEQTVLTESTYSTTQDDRRYYVSSETKKGYKVHPLDRIVDSRMKFVRTINEDGSVTRARIEVPYKKDRYERTEPFVNLGKTYPSHSKKRGGTQQ